MTRIGTYATKGEGLQAENVEFVSGINDYYTGLSIAVATASANAGLETGAAAAADKTATGVEIDLSKFSHNTLYLSITSPVALNAMTTGIEVNVYIRGTSTMAWASLVSQSGLGTGHHAIKLVGSGGLANGIWHLPETKIEIVNQSNSGTATIDSMLVSRAMY